MPNYQHKKALGWGAAAAAALAAAFGIHHAVTTPGPENTTARVSGGDWRKPQNGKTYQISGTQPGAVKWQGVSGVTLTGPAILDARDKGAYTLFLNGCSNITFRKITFTGGQLGVFVQRGSGFTFEGCSFTGNDQTGFLTNFCSGVTLRDCTAGKSRREHGIYLSDGTSDVTIERLKSVPPVGRMMVQVNGSDAGTVKNVTLKDCDLGPSGFGVSLSVYGADGVKATGCKFRDKVGVRAASKCPRNVVVERCTFYGSVKVEGKDGCAAPKVVN